MIHSQRRRRRDVSVGRTGVLVQHVPSRYLSFEALEDRRVLSAVVTAASAGAFSTLSNFLDIFVDVDQILPEEARNRLGSDQGIGNTLTYQAFQGEINDVSITQEVSDFFYLINEGNSLVPVISVPLAFHPKLVEDLSAGFSFVLHIDVKIGQFIDIPDANAVVPNASSILEFIPGIGGPDGILTEMTNLLGSGLSFGLGDVVEFIGDAVGFVQDSINTVVGPIVGVVGDVAHEICEVIDVIPFVNPDCDAVQNFTEQTLTNLVSNLPILPFAPPGLLQFGTDIFEALTSTFTTEGVYVSTLDGADNIDLSLLNGVDQMVYAGSESDVITGGGGDADIKLFGEGGRDRFIVNNTFLFDVPNYYVDGGSGNDILVVEGSPGNDIIRLKGSGGSLSEIIREAPNPGVGVMTDEEQVITLPTGASGTFTLTFDGETTGPILASGNGGTVQSALVLLPNISSGDVIVSGGVGGPYTVAFQDPGAYANTDAPNIVGDGAGLTLAGGTMTVQTTVEAGSGLGTNETQQVTLPSQASDGTFTLTFGGDPTVPPLAFNAPASVVQDALLDLSSIGPGNVEVTGPDGGPYNIEFTGALGLADQAAIVADGSLLKTDVSATVMETTKGTPGTNESQQISVPGAATGGTFRLTFGGDTTGPLPFDATVSDILAEIQQLGSIGDPGNVIVTGTNGGPWDAEFVNDLREIGQPAFTENSDGLIGGVTLDPTTTPHGGQNERHRIRICSAGTTGVGSCEGIVTGGTFTMDVTAPDPTVPSIDITRTTVPLSFNATAAEMQDALEDLANVGDGNVSVTKSLEVSVDDTLTQWVVRFQGDLAGENLPGPSLDTSSLIVTDVGAAGDSPFAFAVTTLQGSPGADEVQTITPSVTLTSGDFTLTFDAEETSSIPFDADGSDVQAAL